MFDDKGELQGLRCMRNFMRHLRGSSPHMYASSAWETHCQAVDSRGHSLMEATCWAKKGQTCWHDRAGNRAIIVCCTDDTVTLSQMDIYCCPNQNNPAPYKSTNNGIDCEIDNPQSLLPPSVMASTKHDAIYQCNLRS